MKFGRPQESLRYQATGQERLEQLARFLEELPAGKLTFSKWYGQGKGCAIGLAAAMDPWFQAQGLGLRHDNSLRECQPVFNGRKDWCAVVAFLEITHAVARDLFSPEGYCGDLRPDPKTIAARIRRHLAVETREPEAVEII
jgi:hypothetical protein